MSLKKEEILWLMENCGAQAPVEATKINNAVVDQSNMTISGRPDHEFEMGYKQLKRAAEYAQSLSDRMRDMDEANLPAWVQAKITTASDYIAKVYHYLEDHLGGGAQEEPIEVAHIHENTKKLENIIEIDLNISKDDMKKLKEGGRVTLKDKSGLNSFNVKITSS